MASASAVMTTTTWRDDGTTMVAVMKRDDHDSDDYDEDGDEARPRPWPR